MAEHARKLYQASYLLGFPLFEFVMLWKVLESYGLPHKRLREKVERSFSNAQLYGTISANALMWFLIPWVTAMLGVVAIGISYIVIVLVFKVKKPGMGRNFLSSD